MNFQVCWGNLIPDYGYDYTIRDGQGQRAAKPIMINLNIMRPLWRKRFHFRVLSQTEPAQQRFHCQSAISTEISREDS